MVRLPNPTFNCLITTLKMGSEYMLLEPGYCCPCVRPSLGVLGVTTVPLLLACVPHTHYPWENNGAGPATMLIPVLLFIRVQSLDSSNVTKASNWWSVTGRLRSPVSLVEDFSSTTVLGDSLLGLPQLPSLGLVQGSPAVSLFVLNVPLDIWHWGRSIYASWLGPEMALLATFLCW